VNAKFKIVNSEDNFSAAQSIMHVILLEQPCNWCTRPIMTVQYILKKMKKQASHKSPFTNNETAISPYCKKDIPGMTRFARETQEQHGRKNRIFDHHFLFHIHSPPKTSFIFFLQRKGQKEGYYYAISSKDKTKDILIVRGGRN
jgi:hypothetical protein